MATGSTGVFVPYKRKGKTCTTLKEHLGCDIYVTVGYFNGEKVVNIRKWGENAKGHPYATKAGVAMHPGRFASLILQMPLIDKAYAYVQERPDEWRTIHIGGELYASFCHDFKHVNLRHFFKVPLPMLQLIITNFKYTTNLRSFLF